MRLSLGSLANNHTEWAQLPSVSLQSVSNRTRDCVYTDSESSFDLCYRGCRVANLLRQGFELWLPVSRNPDCCWKVVVAEINCAQPCRPEIDVNCRPRTDATENANFQANRVGIVRVQRLTSS